MGNENPQIKCLPNGPYLLKNDESAPVTLHRQQQADEKAVGVALCRCGSSRNKPFCDGTHSKIGFSDEKLTDGSLDKRDSYVGEKITIHDNRGICAHAGICTDNLKTVFRMGQEPWIDPDGADLEDIIRIVESCPSGALAYSFDGNESRSIDGEARISVIKDGPYAVSGNIELTEQPSGESMPRKRYTLCRCGASKNKPFCDGSHWHVGFKDEAD